MSSSIQDAAIRRRPRADVVAFTMGRGRFRLLVVAIVAALGGAFAGGVWWGRGSTDAAPVADVSSPKPTPAKPAVPAPAAVDEPAGEVAPKMELARIGGDEPSPSQPEVDLDVDPDPEAEVVSPPVVIRDDAPSGGYGLQLGAYETRAEAVEFVETHADALADRRVHIIATEVEGKGTWHRVRVGHFDNKRVARRARRNMTDALRATSIVVKYR